MIAELFYPKELKDAISKLRAENDLNEEALKNIKNEVYYSSFVILFISIVTAITLYFKYGWLYALIGLGIGICAFLLEIILATRKYSNIAYVLSMGKWIVPEKIDFEKHRGDLNVHQAWNISFQYKVGMKSYKNILWRIRKIHVSKQDVDNKELKISYLEDRPNRSVPILSFFKSKFLIIKGSRERG